jgi:hypothetical protein
MNRPNPADLKTPEFWLYIGVGSLGFTALVVAMNAVEAPTLAVLAVGMLFGWLITGMQRRAKDRIDARRDDTASGNDREVRV